MNAPYDVVTINLLVVLAYLFSFSLARLHFIQMTTHRKLMKFVYIGNVPGTDFENTLCPVCKKIVLERRGFRVVQQQLNGSTCVYCGAKIPGRWN